MMHRHWTMRDGLGFLQRRYFAISLNGVVFSNRQVSYWRWWPWIQFQASVRKTARQNLGYVRSVLPRSSIGCKIWIVLVHTYQFFVRQLNSADHLSSTNTFRNLLIHYIRTWREHFHSLDFHQILPRAFGDVRVPADSMDRLSHKNQSFPHPASSNGG